MDLSARPVWARTIQQLRAHGGQSQRDLARALGVTAAAVSNWERGANEPSTRQLGLIADYYGVSIDTLLGRTTGPEASDKPYDAVLREHHAALQERADSVALETLLALWARASPRARKIAIDMLTELAGVAPPPDPKRQEASPATRNIFQALGVGGAGKESYLTFLAVPSPKPAVGYDVKLDKPGPERKPEEEPSKPK